MPDGFFDNLSELNTLVLDVNPLILTNETFGPNLEKLEVLSLNYCELEELEVAVFDNLL